MLTLTPSFVQSQATPSKDIQATRKLSHVSYFRSLYLDMQIYSPSVRVVDLPGLPTSRACPVFGDRDKIEGKIIFDPSCPQNGRLTISLEGAFEYLSTEMNSDEDYPRNPTITRHRHVFLSSSAAIPLTSRPESRSTIRDALSVRKRPSTSSLSSPTQRSYDFVFELPQGPRPDEEMPPSFSSATPAGDLKSRPNTEDLNVSYKIKVLWEGYDGSGIRTALEAPVLFQPGLDFESVDSSAAEPQSWLEMALMPERPIPFTCAVTLPRPHSFSRCTSIPYFVVFTTDTKSPSLIKEIAADATIVVSLLRKVTVSYPPTPRKPTLPDTPPPSDESDGPTSPFAVRSKIFKRSLRTHTRSPDQDEFFSGDNSSRVEPPLQTFSVMRTLETQVSIGFPKRPRVSDTLQSPPDGLLKGNMRLSRDMLPSTEWRGMSVKYYLDISVLVGQDALRARVPIRVY